jgi:rhodanese-related sulfurtransferase
MKKFISYFLVVMLIPALVLTGCKDDNDPQPAEKGDFNDLKTYLVNQGLDLPVIITDWIITAPAVHNNGIAEYYIIDLRNSDDFSTLGHIEGAVNSTLGNILETAKNATKPILVVCYTGQAAGHGVVALRMSGYLDAKVLMWGMSSWNANTAGPWQGGFGDVAEGNTNWMDGDQTSTTSTYGYPEWETTSTEGADILAERVELLIAGGFQGVTNTGVLDNPADYFINNFWDQLDVEHYGHIKDAFRIKPMSFANANISSLNPDETVVTYCWTGQTSSMVTAYLNILGYNAKSITFGTNGMIHTKLESHKWTDAEISDFELIND